MSIPATPQFLPGDPKFIDQIVNQIKSQGIFDQWRKECLADVDTKPAYQNLTFRVDSSVASFLGKQKWRPDTVKNQMRENLRKHILDLGIIEKGVDRIVEQVVQPKVLPIFHPAVENAIYSFLGIQKPKTEVAVKPANAIAVGNSPLKKTFRPMPVSVTSREQEDATPPPGEEFGLEAITPSPDSRCDSARIKELADEVSDVSMEDVRPTQESGLERICSPISPQSYSNMGSEKMDESDSRPASRVASALSAISSNDDLPSGSPVGPSPVTPGDDNTMPPGEENIHSDSESDRNLRDDEDDESDFSSPEFEKLEINQPASRTATPTDEKMDEEDSRKEADDHANWRPRNGSNDSDRKPDEDPGQSGPATSHSSSHSAHQSLSSEQTSSSTEPKSDTSKSKSTAPSSEVKDEIIDAPEAAEPALIKTVATLKQEKIEKTAEGMKRKDRSRSRERKESHKSDKRDRSSHKDRHKDRHRDRSRDRDRKKERKDSERHSKSSSSKSERDRDSERHKSSKKGKDRDRSRDRHRNKDDRDRQRSKSESDRKSHREKDRKSEKHPRSPPHPMAHLWKRPAEKPRALADWLARFPDRVFDEANVAIDALTEISVSPVTSYYPSDAESVIYLSDIEVDSDLEERLKGTGGKVLYKEVAGVEKSVEEPVRRKSETEQSAYWSHTPTSDDVGRSENTDHTASSKRIRKVNTRYSDSYVGSEFRKVIHMQQHHTPELPQRVSRPSSGGRAQQVLGDYEQNVIAEPSPEEHDREESEFGPSEPKRIKHEQPLPSSPESVQSDPSLGQNNPPASPAADVRFSNDDEVRKETSSPVNRRRASMKPPQKRYDDADLYKPRPVITPSSRRSRRQEDA